MSKLILGYGINDTNEPTQITKNGKVILCKAYQSWVNILKKCYGSGNDGSKIVDPSWLRFSNFKSWYEINYREGTKLNNRLFGDGTVYSPDTTVFLDKLVVYLIRDTSFDVGKTGSRGVVRQKHSHKYHVRCNNPIKSEQEHVGYFTNIEDAEAAWLERKRSIANKIANLQTDDRIKNAILNYF